MIHDTLHRQLLKNKAKVETWLANQRRQSNVPFYCSFDIRDASFKVAEVDANIYPAGFNNICEVDRARLPELFKKYIDFHYGPNFKNILLLTEEHTSNLFYWENVYVLHEALVKAGKDVRVGIPKDFPNPTEIKTPKGLGVLVYGTKRIGDEVLTSDGFKPQLIISNNDFSNALEEWTKGLTTPINPPRELGWYRRKKSTHFDFYNALASELCDMIGVDPWYLQVRTELITGFDIDDEDSRKRVAQKVDNMLAQIKAEYEQRGIEETPVVFLKNNSGTYGMGVTSLRSGQELLDWNSKNRKKMNAAKGGRGVDEVILQEGIPTVVMTEKSVAEPVIYCVGCDIAGGFLRTHTEKGTNDSLNSPGAVFKSMCMSELRVNVEGNCEENVYAWVARLSMLAITREADAMNVSFPQFTPGCV